MRFRHRVGRRRVHGRTFTLSIALVLATPFAFGMLRAYGEPRPNDPISVRAELGAEYDDNVHRAERIQGARSPSIVSSSLARGVLGWSSVGHLADNQDIFVSLLGAAKTFTEAAARNENVAVVETALSWRAAVRAASQLSAGAAYYEAIQAGTAAERELSGEARDFRSITPALRVGHSLSDGNGLAELAGGYRVFVYKPAHAYDFQGPVVGLDYRWQRESADGAADWELSAGAGTEFRRFAGPRLVPSLAGCLPASCPPAADPLGRAHSDQFTSGHLDLTRTGHVLLGGSYTLQWNHSNSYTESLFRHIAAVRLATALPWQMYVAARAEFVFVSYADHVVLSTGPTGSASASIDDENRNQLRIELDRSVTHDVRVVARYSIYMNALGQTAVGYHRQTLTLSLALSTRN